MAFAPSAFWNSRSITHLANYLSPSLPMNSSDESNFDVDLRLPERIGDFEHPNSSMFKAMEENTGKNWRLASPTGFAQHYNNFAISLTGLVLNSRLRNSFGLQPPRSKTMVE